MEENQSTSKRLTIIGLGSVGSTLARTIISFDDYELFSLFNRTEEEARELSEVLGVNHWGAFPEEAEEVGDIVLLSLSDDVIPDQAKKLAALQSDWSGTTVFHHSGTLTSSALKPLHDQGAAVAALHPLQTFHDDSHPEDFMDIYFNFEGDEAAFEVAENLTERLGADIIKIKAEVKPYLHASAVMACNYLAALLDASGAITEQAGLNRKETLKMLMPLINKTLENIERVGTSEALSGPIARGDAGTVENHLKLLTDAPRLQNLYRDLGRYTLTMADEIGDVDEEKLDDLRNLLDVSKNS